MPRCLSSVSLDCRVAANVRKGVGGGFGMVMSVSNSGGLRFGIREEDSAYSPTCASHGPGNRFEEILPSGEAQNVITTVLYFV